MGTKEKDLRAAIVVQCRAMNAAGLSAGSVGNISVRLGDAMVITPSAVPYEVLRPELLATMPLNGEYGAWSGPVKPSTEWRFHLDIMRARPDVGAIVHSHPPYCTALATLNRPILAAHYMIADFGGSMIECTRYAPFGTKELSELAVAGLGPRHAVLLGNHGAIAVGADLDQLEELPDQGVAIGGVGDVDRGHQLRVTHPPPQRPHRPAASPVRAVFPHLDVAA